MTAVRTGGEKKGGGGYKRENKKRRKIKKENIFFFFFALLFLWSSLLITRLSCRLECLSYLYITFGVFCAFLSIPSLSFPTPGRSNSRLTTSPFFSLMVSLILTTVNLFNGGNQFP